MLSSFLLFRKERKRTIHSFGSHKSPKTRKKNGQKQSVLFKERKRTERTERKRTRCPTLVERKSYIIGISIIYNFKTPPSVNIHWNSMFTDFFLSVYIVMQNKKYKKKDFWVVFTNRLLVIWRLNTDKQKICPIASQFLR